MNLIFKALASCCMLLSVQSVHTQLNGHDFEKLAIDVDSILSEAEKKGFSGTFLLKKNDKEILFYKGYGFSDCELKKKTSTDMVYDIGSITKAITAAAVLKLVQNGKLNFDDKLGKFFPDWPEDKNHITILHLLTHKSGLEESLGMDEDTSILKEKFIQKVRQSKLLFTPGDSMQYSNTGYTMLGYLIEDISRVSYEKFVEQELFSPAGINKIGYMIQKWHKEEIVCGRLNKKPWGATKDYFGISGPLPIFLRMVVCCRMQPN